MQDFKWILDLSLYQIFLFNEQFLFTPQWAFNTNQTHETALFFI